MLEKIECSNLARINPTNGYVWQGKELEGGGQFDPPYLKALKSQMSVTTKYNY